jgi:hypothetical protein
MANRTTFTLDEAREIGADIGIDWAGSASASTRLHQACPG